MSKPISEALPTTSDPLELLRRWQPDLFGAHANTRADEPPPVLAYDLRYCIGLPHIDALSRMSAQERKELPRQTLLGAVYYYLINPGADWWFQELAATFRRYQKIQYLAQQERAEASLLHLIEAQQPSMPLWRDSAAQQWRFRACAAEREAWLRILPFCEPSVSSVVRTMRCGQGAIVKRRRNTDEYAVETVTCGKRTCPVCAIRHRLRIRERLETALAGPWRSHEWRFITLTLRADGKALGERITRLGKAFRRLRQQKIWETTQTEGVGVIEVKWSKVAGGWNVHLHILSRGRFIQQAALSTAWLQATGDSSIVDIRSVGSRDRAIKYLCKYIGKTPSDQNQVLSDKLLGDYYVGIARRRMMIGFGSLKSLPLERETEEEKKLNAEWLWVDTLERILEYAAAGNPVAIEIMRKLEGSKNGNQPLPWFDG